MKGEIVNHIDTRKVIPADPSGLGKDANINFDFDNTMVEGHCHKFLVDVAQGKVDVSEYPEMKGYAQGKPGNYDYNKIAKIVLKAVGGFNHPDEFLKIIKDLLASNIGVTITSFTHYPEIIRPLLVQGLGLTEAEVSKISIVAGFPMVENPEKQGTFAGDPNHKSGKNFHLMYANSLHKNNSSAFSSLLIDDSVRNSSQAVFVNTTGVHYNLKDRENSLQKFKDEINKIKSQMKAGGQAQEISSSSSSISSSMQMPSPVAPHISPTMSSSMSSSVTTSGPTRKSSGEKFTIGQDNISHQSVQVRHRQIELPTTAKNMQKLGGQSFSEFIKTRANINRLNEPGSFLGQGYLADDNFEPGKFKGKHAYDNFALRITDGLSDRALHLVVRELLQYEQDGAPVGTPLRNNSLAKSFLLLQMSRYDRDDPMLKSILSDHFIHNLKMDAKSKYVTSISISFGGEEGGIFNGLIDKALNTDELSDAKPQIIRPEPIKTDAIEPEIQISQGSPKSKSEESPKESPKAGGNNFWSLASKVGGMASTVAGGLASLVSSSLSSSMETSRPSIESSRPSIEIEPQLLPAPIKFQPQYEAAKAGVDPKLTVKSALQNQLYDLVKAVYSEYEKNPDDRALSGLYYSLNKVYNDPILLNTQACIGFIKKHKDEIVNSDDIIAMLEVVKSKLESAKKVDSISQSSSAGQNLR